ncbi:MAG: DUF3536 domain-containing protein [Nanoarchaeota archaeon]
MDKKYVAQHWHFYQPRNNDFWAKKITEECYKPNSENGILDHISYNIGPTLIEWFEENAKDTLENMLSSDNGQALGQAYNHRILPLARYDEDLKTQIVWGKKHFKKYFGREPKGIWLPETATDKRTCRELVKQGIEYTIGAWWQGASMDGSQLDFSKPHEIDLGQNLKIIYFFFDPTSAQIAFNSTAKASTKFLENADVALERIAMDINDGGIALLAYDGETFGHHHKFADKWAGYFPQAVEKRSDIDMITLDQFLKENRVYSQASLIENSSWSCLCGNLSRWTDGCSCAGGSKNYQRILLDILEKQEDIVHDIFVSESGKFLNDVWDARNDYIDVKLENISLDDFFDKYKKDNLSKQEKESLLNLFEAEYLTQLSFTSCGWFFPDVNIQTRNNIHDALKFAVKIDEATGKDISENLAGLEWMLK